MVSYLQRKLLHNVSQPFLEAKAQSYSQRSGAQRHAQRTKADFCGSFLLIRAWPGSRVGPEWGINTFLPKQGTLVFKWGTGPQWGTSWPALNLTPSFHRLPGKCSYRGTSESKRTFDMTFFFYFYKRLFLAGVLVDVSSSFLCWSLFKCWCQNKANFSRDSWGFRH